MKPRISRDQALVSLMLIGAVVLVYWPTVRYDFVDYDDVQYVVENPYLPLGLSAEGVWRAVAQPYYANWHPLTSLTYLVEYRLFALDAGPYHAVNIMLHALASVLLFLLLRRMTGAHWRSAFVAALFALHPLHVESVAWVSERKDVLSGLFWMLTCLAYVRFSRDRSLRNEFLVLAAFAAGLLSKPMVVTLPVVLLLLDYWPLNRVEALRAEVGSTMRAFWRLALEKMPLFVLAFLSAVVTVVVQQQSGAVMDLQEFSFLVRLENAVLVVIMYLANAVWPSGLAVYYPHPGEAISHIFVSGALVAATGITALAMKYARRAPYLIVGWLWYLVTLAPVIGIVQVGDQAMADRYTYLPLIGPFIAVTWGIHDIASRSARFRRVAAAAAISAIAVLTVVAARQVQYWEGTETLWRRALAVTSENYRAHNNLGKALVDRGSLLDGERHLAEASRLRPDNAVYLNNWGLALVRFGDVDAAIGKFYRASELDGAFAEPRLNLGAAYATRGELRLAERHYREALIQSPDVPRVHYNLGLLDAEREMWTEAESHYRAALDRFPEYVDAHFDLGLALARQEKYPEADRHFEKTLQIRPNYQRTLMLFEGGEVDSGEIDLPSSRR